MKKIYLSLIVFALVMTSCKENTKEEPLNDTTMEKVTLAPISDSVLESAVIYEANVRQFSPEGTFDAFTAEIPKLKELGVKIIWLMPIHPISMEKRKAREIYWLPTSRIRKNVKNTWVARMRLPIILK